MLRIATIDDIDAVLEMALKFAEATPYKDMVSESKIRQTVTTALESPNEETVVIICEEDNNPIGLIAGAVTNLLLSDAKMATELMWWVNEDKRGTKAGKELIEALEFWANKMGCKAIVMVCLDDRVGGFYEKNGYRLYERSYLKEI